MTGDLTPTDADPSTPVAVLRAYLQTLHRRRGEPSTRALAKDTGSAISHTTVSLVLRCRTCPKWGPLELVVEALGGDVEEARLLWIAIRDMEHPLPQARAGGERLEPAALILGMRDGTTAWDIEVPLDVTVRAVIAKLVASPSLPFVASKHWQLFWAEGGRTLAPTESLRNAGVRARHRLDMYHD
ncbi:hypothetical protein [Kitasatospora griseola]|uniref:hypothetical protein n=1 Tax=Kitasatospora griseola TaxID=2064 RepID=UPI00342C442A